MGTPNEPGLGQAHAPEATTYPQPAAPVGEPQGPPAPQPVSRGRRRSPSMNAAALARQLRTPETKEFFKTSEFALTILGVLILMIAAAAQANFDAPQMWRLFTAILIAYIISRGIAKAGSNRGEPDNR